MRWFSEIKLTVWLMAAVMAMSGGCHVVVTDAPPAGYGAPAAISPHELDKVVLPRYRIEPPDVLSIDAIHVVPRSPYRLHTLDSIMLQVDGTLPDFPISGVFTIQPGGTINLGDPYGTVRIVGQTLEEAQATLDSELRKRLREPRVIVSLGEIAGKQQIAGEFLVGPDGTITLGSYGSVSVIGLTVDEAKSVIEEHLAQHLEEPEVSVNVFSYNSKVFYVVTQGAGLGDRVARFPIMGNETVIDAISQIEGLTEVSSTKIWVARPGRNLQGRPQIMPVDWPSITQWGDFRTNYQLLPGDRVYVAQDSMVAFDSWLAKCLSPFERIFGFTLLGTGTVTRLSGRVLQGGGARNSSISGVF